MRLRTTLLPDGNRTKLIFGLPSVSDVLIHRRMVRRVKTETFRGLRYADDFLGHEQTFTSLE